MADKSTGLSNRRSNPQSVCQWTHISWSYIYTYIYMYIVSFSLKILYVYGTFMYISLASASTWFAWFLWVCSASHFVFIASYFFFAFSLFIIFGMGGLCKIFCGLSKFLKNAVLVVVVVSFVYKQTVFLFFLFVAQINTSSINYPASETADRCS